MARKKFPNLCILKQPGRKARLYIRFTDENGKRIKKYYGFEGDPEAVKRYQFDRLLWETNNAPIPLKSGNDAKEAKQARRAKKEKQARTQRPAGILVADLVDAFMSDARTRYVKHGRQTGTAANYWQALKPVLMRYGEKLTSEFTLDTLEEYQRELDRSRRLCRRQVNKRIQAITFVFTWGARHRINGERYVPAEIASELRLIAPLRSGYADSVDHPRKGAVSQADVDAVLPFLSSTVADMVRVQVLTGARPQEIRLMRAGDFETVSPDLWYYRPSEYKTEQFGGEKIVSIGPRAIAILAPRISGKEPGEYLFAPSEANAEKNARRTPDAQKTPSRLARDARRAENPLRRFNGCYRRDTYALAIKRACIRAGVPVWTPYQLRKLRGTELDRAFGAETAAAVLGHRDVATTLRHYIDPRREQADEIARKCG